MTDLCETGRGVPNIFCIRLSNGPVGIENHPPPPPPDPRRSRGRADRFCRAAGIRRELRLRGHSDGGDTDVVVLQVRLRPV